MTTKETDQTREDGNSEDPVERFKDLVMRGHVGDRAEALRLLREEYSPKEYQRVMNEIPTYVKRAQMLGF